MTGERAVRHQGSRDNGASSGEHKINICAIGVGRAEVRFHPSVRQPESVRDSPRINGRSGGRPCRGIPIACGDRDCVAGSFRCDLCEHVRDH